MPLCPARLVCSDAANSYLVLSVVDAPFPVDQRDSFPAILQGGTKCLLRERELMSSVPNAKGIGSLGVLKSKRVDKGFCYWQISKHAWTCFGFTTEEFEATAGGRRSGIVLCTSFRPCSAASIGVPGGPWQLPCISAALLHAHCDFCAETTHTELLRYDEVATTRMVMADELSLAMQPDVLHYSVSQAAVGQSLGLILESGADRASGDLLEVELPTTDFSLARAAAECETSAFVLPAMELRGSGKEMKLEGLVTAFSRTTVRTLNNGNGFHH
ncbi:hypothetical protein MYCTH_2110132 [Thermothelomyces thermophilus ATCC 42464]|uniref:Uncharacterized protein n=1 Tax=Thermothelomyces thermophilus (strain ATCC 42464 / BCRC 31852 / DSM 1799) TaxID=573729 RepID=G2QEF4_THET4|nr:uncharacterized protein MYCTH_2110132 [Thermothelomyces thermophilus ATCC 42464]AEO57737.1 hypothetical protein MYCTH_2110132 [Thermothelomyces thermophilus ATCC 42464]